MTRVGLTSLVLLALAGCRCTMPPTQETKGELRLSAERLDFGKLALGVSHELEVDFVNVGRGPLAIAFSVPTPFVASETEFPLEGGATRSVRFTFGPTALGAARADVTGLAPQVLTLEGEGIAACVGSSCRSARFDLSTRQCVETTLPDDTSCRAACLGGEGRCVDGECYGTASGACDDANVCTVDACMSDGGCVHLASAPPRRGACEVAICDPVTGYRFEPVEEGTLCGAPTCATAKVCINGDCVSRPTANAADDCLYTGVCSQGRTSTGVFTCASTRSGRLRCWGDPDLLGRDGGRSLPDFVPAATDVQQPVCVQAKPRWLDSQGQLQPDNPLGNTPSTQYVDVRSDPLNLTGSGSAFRALTRDGVHVRSQGGGATLVATGVERLCSTEYFIADGGQLFHVAQPGVALASNVRTCGFPINTVVAFNDGSAARLYQLLPVADAGVTLIGGGSRGAVLFLGNETRDFSGRIAGPTWPFVPTQVTQEWGNLCGVGASGQLACMAAIDGTPLSPKPDLPLEVGDGGWAWVKAGPGLVWDSNVQVVSRDGRAFAAVGRFTQLRDAGTSTLEFIDGGESTGRVRDVSTTCVLFGTTMRCDLSDGGVSWVPDVLILAERAGGVTARGELVDGEGNVVDTNVLPGSDFSFRAHFDGGITYPPTGFTFAVPGPFGPGSVVGGGGCVVSPQFQAWCWSGGQSPSRMPLPFGVRLVSGNERQGCAVIGDNGVRCWGLGSRFRTIAFSERLAQVSVSGSQNRPLGCVRTEAGRVFCWGDNEFGQLGTAPYDGTFVVPVD